MPLKIMPLTFSLLLTPVLTLSAHAQNHPDWCEPYTEIALTSTDIPGFNELSTGNYNIDLSGDTLIVYSNDWDNSDHRNAVLVFVINEDGWTHQDTILPPEDIDITAFGISAAIDGDTIVVGDTYYRHIIPQDGAAFVYSRSNDTWTLDTILQGSPTSDTSNRRERFGKLVEIEQDTIVVGTPHSSVSVYSTGAVYVFDKVDHIWEPTAILIPEELDNAEGYAHSIAFSEDTILVGFNSIQSQFNTPISIVYSKDDSIWERNTILHAQDDTIDFSVSSYAIHNDTIVVGSTNYPIAHNDQGAALVFKESEDNWTQQSIIPIPDDQEGNFGLNVEIRNDQIAVANVGLWTPFPNDPINYVALYKANNDEWIQISSIYPTNTRSRINYGHALAIQGDIVIAGNSVLSYDDFVLTEFDLYCDYTCYADLNNDKKLDFFDFSIYRNAFLAHDPLADFHPDGIINLFDLFEYMIQFNRGFYEPPF